MSASDAILIGEDWISEHFFTTDAKTQSFRARVIARRKQWDDKTDAQSVRARFTAARSSLLAQFASLEDDGELAAEIHDDLVGILGYNALGLTGASSGPVTLFRELSLPNGPSVALIAAKPVGTAEDLLDRDSATLSEPFDLDDSNQVKSVSRLLSALFVAEESPDFALVIAGRVALIVERERWPEGRYLAIDLQLICERSDDKKGGETDIALACLSSESLAPDAEGNIWWHAVLDESINHTVGVSRDLREGVRLSIEIIANDVVTRRNQLDKSVLPASEAQPLAKQSLRFLYRILFLLYAEASPELGVLPIGATEYEQGYSLDRLRELIQKPLTSSQAEDGTHLYDSLAVLFRLVDQGYAPVELKEDEGLVPGLTFRSLKADLFRPEATAFIDEVRLSNACLQRVLQNLLLSKERVGRDRGFISYAELGINQLGAVYEGLMSYTGRFAETDLYEVAKGGDGSKGSWLVPVDRARGIDDEDFVRYEDPITSESKPVSHAEGSFVFRLAGRERQQSASYYTPEVLTRFVVGQALEELLDQGETSTSAEEILDLTVCEPALGSGAFAIEAVRQLATEYLKRRQDETGERIEPEEYPRELQKVKAYLALHKVYGVDLNATAVELAEISLWLDTMMEGLEAPWFGLHLRRGNSLIGARHAVFDRWQVAKKTWLKDVPRDVPLTNISDDVNSGRNGLGDGQIHHFLLPAVGWGSAIGAKEAKNLAPEELDRLKAWRKRILVKPTKQQVDSLVGLGRRVEILWQLSWRRLTIAEGEIRRSIDVWGADDLDEGGVVTREQIEESLSDKNGAYQRLRRVMDAWCAMWFWPLTEETTPPSLDDWIETLQQLLGLVGNSRKALADNQLSLASATSWEDLGIAEENELAFAQVEDVQKTIENHPWLGTAERVAARQGFFHWELDFAPVFACGGFDLQVGNPPWVRPRSDVEALLAEADPWWQLKGKSTAAENKRHREFALSIEGTRDLVLDGTTEVASVAAFLGHAAQYPHLVGLQPDLYRCFMEQTWRHAKPSASVALVHLESHFTDENGGLLRRATYRRLRRHWQFINELLLFEIEDHKRYGISVFGSPQEPNFLQAASIYHPDTIERSLKHDGSGDEPGIKDPDGNWDVRPHASRIVRVNHETLASWHAFLETDDVAVSDTRMVYAVNRSTAKIVAKLATAPRLARFGFRFSIGWQEKNDRTKGRFDSEWGVPESWDDVILQGPHIHVASPFVKTPNRTMRNNQDWTATDFEVLQSDAIPATSYQPRGDRADYDAAYLHWETEPGKHRSARDFFRLAWRNMAANTGERTFIPALIPPGAAHIHGLTSAALPADLPMLALAAGFASSFILDFAVRVAPKSTISPTAFARLPIAKSSERRHAIALRILRMNCVTNAYAEIWHECFDPSFRDEAWTGGMLYEGRAELGAVSGSWSPDVPIRRASDRRQAQLEIDALVAIALGITPDELCTIYRTQFPVLYGYDKARDYFDQNGRLVPSSIVSKWRNGGGITSDLSSGDLVHRHPQSGVEYQYKPPFSVLDREADLRSAYASLIDR